MLAGLAPLLGVHSASLRGRLLGPVPTSQSSAVPGPVCVYDVFWLLSFGFYVSAPPRLAPP